MPLVPVTSPDDPLLAPYHDLRHHNRTRDSAWFIAEGNKLVARLLTSRFATHSILCDANYVTDLTPHVPADVPIFVATNPVLEATIGFNFHRGCLACGLRPQRNTLESWQPPSKAIWTVVACPDVQDPTNLGTLLRNCAAFDVDLVLLGAGCADPFSRRVLRVSMGAVLSLSIVESRDLISDLTKLRAAHGVECIATVLDPAAERLHDALRPRRAALLFGSEGHGLDANWAAFAERRVTIPMPVATDSLNVAVASGIFLYHFTRCAGLC